MEVKKEMEVDEEMEVHKEIDTSVAEKIDMEKRFANIQDLTDPTLLDDLQILLEQIQEEDEEFIKALLDKKDEMVIAWEQPWYQKSNSVTRPLKPVDDDTLENFRTDAICFEESEIIEKNWKKFRKLYGIPNTPASLARWRNTSRSRHPNTSEELVRRFVISFLAQGLQRTIYQVYKYFVTHYGTPKKGFYAKYEENILAVCLYHNPSNVVPYLSTVLGREPRGIYKKLLQMYNGKPEKKKLKWTLSLATKFLKLLMQYTGEPLENLKNKQFDKSVWLQLESDMEQQYIYLQMFWYHTFHVQLFVHMDVKINRIRKRVLKKLKLYPYQIWSDIRWKEILKHFPDGFTFSFLYNVTRKIYTKCEGYRNMPMEKVIDYGLEKIKTMRSKRLKTLVLNENQELKVIRYDNKC